MSANRRALLKGLLREAIETTGCRVVPDSLATPTEMPAAMMSLGGRTPTEIAVGGEELGIDQAFDVVLFTRAEIRDGEYTVDELENDVEDMEDAIRNYPWQISEDFAERGYMVTVWGVTLNAPTTRPDAETGLGVSLISGVIHYTQA